MDKSSNSTLEFRLPSELHEKFKLACSVSRVNPSSVLRSLVQEFIKDKHEYLNALVETVTEWGEQNETSNSNNVSVSGTGS